MATISIRGARTHNLAELDIDIPRNQLVVAVGVSGSGKSSLIFDTIAAEAGAELNETFPPFARNRLPRWSRPDVDHIWIVPWRREPSCSRDSATVVTGTPSTQTSGASTPTRHCANGHRGNDMLCFRAANMPLPWEPAHPRTTRVSLRGSSGSTCTPRTTSPSASRRPYGASPPPRPARHARDSA